MLIILAPYVALIDQYFFSKIIIDFNSNTRYHTYTYTHINQYQRKLTRSCVLTTMLISIYVPSLVVKEEGRRS